MAFTAEAIIANIESRLGEGGSHVWKFYGLATGTSWCVAEVSYTFNKTGNRTRWYGGKPVFYVPYAQEWMAKHWTTVYDYRKGGKLANVKKGDVIIFMWKIGSRDHIGFARAKGTSAELYTVEGNTSGSRVANRTRAKKYIFGVYRPPYNGSEKLDPLVVDGDMGFETNCRLQRFLGVTEDGVIGRITTKAWQKKIGMSKKDQDGDWGTLTWKATQRYLTSEGFPVMVTGQKNKATIMALQKFLNKKVTK